MFDFVADKLPRQVTTCTQCSPVGDDGAFILFWVGRAWNVPIRTYCPRTCAVKARVSASFLL